MKDAGFEAKRDAERDRLNFISAQGIVPVVGEPLGPISAYGNDRLFVSISVGDQDDETKSKLKALEAAEHPVVYRSLADGYDWLWPQYLREALSLSCSRNQENDSGSLIEDGNGERDAVLS